MALRVKVDIALKEKWSDPKARKSHGLELDPSIWRNEANLDRALAEFMIQVKREIRGLKRG